METEDPISAEVLAALERGDASLRLMDVAADRRDAARAAATIVGALTQDVTLVTGVLLHEAVDASRLEEAQMARELGAPAVAIASELHRLGEFGGGAQWSSAQALSATQAETLRKMLLAIVSDPRLVVARLGIQLARLRAAKNLPAAAREALALETRAVFAPLANRLGVWHVKWQLEDLAFRYLEPDTYARLARQIDEPRLGRERYIREFCETLRAALAEADVTAEVQGRPKHLWSIWRKMQRKQLELDELYDLRAVRIICHSIPDCYAALGVVHGRWSYLPGQFDDYIATPKGNDYRSIHTAVFGPEQRVVEVQIRTEDMDLLAERGIAAHWLYKTDAPQSSNNNAQNRARAWLSELLESQQDAGSSLEFLENVKVDLFPDEVYIFSPKGRIFALPRGATVLDFAYAVHTDVGNRAVAARIDKKLAPLRTRLTSGQTVEIITAPSAVPNPQWLEFVVSSRARTAIRHHLKRLQHEDAVELGHRMLESALDGIEASLERVPPNVLDQYLADSRLRRLEDLLADIALGNRMPQQVALALTEGRAAGERRSTPRLEKIHISGTGHGALSFAACCRPLPGDEIMGYLSSGKGVVVHRMECPNLPELQKNPERWVPVDWDREVEGDFRAGLRVEVLNKPGVLAQVAAAIAEAESNIDNVEYQERDLRMAVMHFGIEVKHRKHLADVMRRVRKLDVVLGIQRL